MANGDDKKKNGSSKMDMSSMKHDVCNGACCSGYGYHHGFSLLRILLALILLVFVFMAGVRMGEFKCFIDGGRYDMYMMRGYRYAPGQPYNVMGTSNVVPQPATTNTTP